MNVPSTLGADLRALRKSRGVTLQELALKLGVSVGWLSQVERDKSSADIATLRRMAAQFDVPMSLFFGENTGNSDEVGHVVRAGNRRVIGQAVGGLVEELLSPDLTDNFEVVHSTFMPGSSIKSASKRDTQEVAYMVSGKLDVWLDDKYFKILTGDSFRIRGQNHRWSNPYSQPAVAIWVISPPVY